MTETKTFAEWISGYIQENIERKKNHFRLSNHYYELYTKMPLSYALKCRKCHQWSGECFCLHNIK